MNNFLQKIKNFSIFELRPEPITISFNDSSLRFLITQKKTPLVLPEVYWREALPKNTVVNGEIKDAKIFVDCLKNGLNQLGIKNKKNIYAVVVLPENATFLKPLSFLKMSREEINASLSTLVEQNIPLSKEETETDWQFTDSEPNAQQTDILIAAALKSNIEKLTDALKETSVTPVIFDIAPLSIVRALINKAEKKPRLIIHFNHDKTIFVLHDGQLIDSAISSSNGIDFMQQKIVDELHPQPSLLVELMNKNGFSTKNPEEKKALENSLIEIIEQINKFKSYSHPSLDKSGAKKQCICQEIILSGYLATVPGIDSYISSKTNLPVVIGNPWQQNGELDVIPKMNLAESLQFCATIGGAIYAREWFLKPIFE